MRRAGVYLAICAAVLIILGGCGPRTLSEKQGEALLQDVRDAQRNLAASGQIHTSIRLGQQLVSADATVHRGDGRMQLEFTSGRADGAQIIQQKDNVWQISPDGKTVRRLPHNPVDTMPHPGRNVTVTTRPGGRIAGRGTKKVVVRPKREVGARMVMWVDRRNSFPLRMDRYSAQGKLVSSTRYREVDFSVRPPEVAELPEDAKSAPRGASRIDTDRAAEILGRMPIRPSYIPDGFEFRGYYLHTNPRRTAVVLRYSDGLHPLNILQLKAPEVGERPGGRREQPQAREDAPRRRGGSAGAGPAGPRRGRQESPQAGGRPRRSESPREPQSGIDHDRGAGQGPRVLQHRVLGRIIRLRQGDLVIVVQGDLPPQELRRIAAGLEERSIDF